MIEVRMYEQAGKIGSRGMAYIAECEVDGVPYSASSRSGASLALARVLVAAGIADQPMRVRQAGLRGFLTWPSLHKAAGFTMEESAGRSIHVGKWVPFDSTMAEKAQG